MSNLSFPLLRTKLRQPLPAPYLVPRQRLLDKLPDRPEATLTLVLASAGSGKTTLIVQWLERLSWPAAWLSLDETDNDLIVFLSYVIAAVQDALPGACSLTQKLVRTPQPPPVAYLAATLVNDLSDITQPFVLVLDDYHHIRDAAIHELVSQLLRHAPPSLRLVISSRFDPPLPLNRLASHGKLVEIRAVDLRFRPSEAQALLERVAGMPLPQERIDPLVADMDGWAVGLHSVALSLRSPDARVNSAGDSWAGDQRRLVGILADEVFGMQPADMRDFLVRTSVLSQLTAPLCQTLLASDASGEAAPIDSKVVLQQLERNSLFVETLDEDHQWYRYHNLFRSFLVRKLEQTRSREEIAALHRCASIWYWEQGSANEAIRHALAAKDAVLAADIVEAKVHGILNREEWPILERWLDLLPKEAIQRRPLLLVAQAWVVYFQFQLQMIPPLLVKAKSVLDEGAAPAAPDSMVRHDLEALHTLLCFVAGDYPGAIESAQRALSRVEPGHTFSRSLAVFFLSMSLYALKGKDKAAELCAKIIDDPLEEVAVKVRALMSLGHIYGIACRPLDQERAARALFKMAQEHDLDVSKAWAHRHLGNAYYERNQLDMAAQHFALGVEQRYLAHFACARDCFVGLALTYQAQGRQEEAEAVASALQAFYVERGLVNLPEFDSFLARLAFLQGDIDRARHSLERSLPARAALSMVAFETATLTRAMVHSIAGNEAQRRAAVAALGDLLRMAEASHATWHQIRVLVLQAIALDRDGQTEEALDAMQQAVRLGYPGRVVTCFVELGPPIRSLLQRLAERGVEPAYMRDLLAAFPSETISDPTRVPGSGAIAAFPGAGLVEPLSAREMEVLALLSRRLSNKEIAATLVVSPLTVKRHMTNIMQKLGVDSRWDAVEQAREIGLIPST